MHLSHNGTNGNSQLTNDTIRGRGIRHRKLTHGELVELAAAAQAGQLNVGNLSKKQACTVFGVSLAEINEAIKARRANGGSEEVTSFVNAWNWLSPAEREAAFRQIGPSEVWDTLSAIVE
jgi:hypothetical protein